MNSLIEGSGPSFYMWKFWKSGKRSKQLWHSSLVLYGQARKERRGEGMQPWTTRMTDHVFWHLRPVAAQLNCLKWMVPYTAPGSIPILIKYSGSLRWTHTCFRIQAAISCPQSKMTWNSFAFFISFRSGFASLVSVGSCRIFKRMLYREGALISSCSRMRPADKEDAHGMEKELWGRSCMKCLICCHFKIYLAT